MRENIPIVFTHRGYSDYMEYSLRQAKYSNPESDVFLLGDDENNRFDFVKHVNSNTLDCRAKEFERYYVHLSTNPYHYELFCIQRWFLICEFMMNFNLEECFLCDTDVLIYSDLKKALAPFRGEKMCVDIHGKEYSFGIVCMKRKNIQKFCDFIMSCYKSPEYMNEFRSYFSTIRDNHQLGGISDMILVGKWIECFSDDELINSLGVYDGGTFDCHIGLPFQSEDDFYQFKNNRKVIHWRNHLPYCFSYKYNREILFHVLHFQGPFKYLMARFYRGPDFPGKTRLDFKFFFANIAAYWYKRLGVRKRFSILFDLYFKQKKNK